MQKTSHFLKEIFVWLFGFWSFETGALYRALAILELTRLPALELSDLAVSGPEVLGLKALLHHVQQFYFLSMRNESLVSHQLKECSSSSDIPGERMKIKC